MQDRWKANLKLLIKYCQDIEKLHIENGADYNDFEENIGYQYAISFCIEQIGEVAKKLRADGIDEKHPQVEWNKIAGLRNRIAHGYASIDLDLVYDISKEDVPVLLIECERIFALENGLDNIINDAKKECDSQKDIMESHVVKKNEFEK